MSDKRRNNKLNKVRVALQKIPFETCVCGWCWVSTIEFDGRRSDKHVCLDISVPKFDMMGRTAIRWS